MNIKLETDTGFTGKYITARLHVGHAVIDIGCGDSMTKQQAKEAGEQLLIAAKELLDFSEQES